MKNWSVYRRARNSLTIAALTMFMTSDSNGATLTVCASGCNYQSAQAALDASKDGDTIVLAAGQNHGSLTIRGTRSNLTIKSSLIDSYPRNYRITRNHPSLARLTWISAGSPMGWIRPTVGSSVLTNAPGNVPQAHSLKVGDRIVINGSRYTPYHCAAVNQPPYTTGACDSSRVGFFNVRTDTGLSNGMVVYFRGSNLPSPLKENTRYYIVSYAQGGTAANADKFKVAATLGGPAITVTQYNPSSSPLVIEVPPLPRSIGDTLYVVSIPTSSTFELAASPGGTPIIWTQFGKAYNGGGFSQGFSYSRYTPLSNIVFDGLEVAPESDTQIYYVVDISRAAGSYDGENRGIKILRSWIHGADDQESFPMSAITFGGRNVEIGWNILEGAYSTGNDTQGIGFTSTGDVNIHDNEIVGATEGIMSGGNTPWFAFSMNTKGIKVHRNYFWKPLKYFIGISLKMLGPNQFQLVPRYGEGDCDTTATSTILGRRCFAYEGDESNPEDSKLKRFEWNKNAVASTITANGAASQSGYVYLLNSALYMRHNFSGSVTCPSGITCEKVTTPNFPAGSTRISIAKTGSSGVFESGSFWIENRNVWSKNHLESKYGDEWSIEGNIFHRQANCDGGSTCQDPAIQFTVGANGSGAGEAVNFAVSSSDSTIKNNIFRHVTAGIVGVGKSFAINNGGTGLAYEVSGVGRNENNRVENNLLIDLGSTEQTPATNLQGSAFRVQNTRGWTIAHNTAVDSRITLIGSAGNTALNFHSNIIVPYRSACPDGGCTTPAATTHIGVQNSGATFPMVVGDGAAGWTGIRGQGYVDSTSTFTNNILMNRNGSTVQSSRTNYYTATTFLVEPADSERDPNLLFSKWEERDNSIPPNGMVYRTANYRLTPSAAAQYPAADTRTIGADIDEIEALTGPHGRDIERGWPTFAVRSDQSITPNATGATLSYLAGSASCLIKIWSASDYKGIPVFESADSSSPVVNSRRAITISNLTLGKTYFGKRWCDEEVDVFQFTTTNNTNAKPASPTTLRVIRQH